MYRRIRTTFILLLVLALSAGAKDAFYPVNTIPAELLENSNSVIRNNKILLEVFAEDKISYTITEIITVLNKNGEGDGVLYIPYDSNSKVDISTANFYDANGDLIKKVKKNEVYDQTYFDGFSMYNDARFKRITPYINNYPYTVEYEYTIDYGGAVDYHDWFPINTYNTSVEQSAYEIRMHDGIELRVKQHMTEPLKYAEKEDGVSVYLWEIQNMAALEYEPLAVSIRELVPNVIVAPNEFEYFGVAGEMTSWGKYGDWAWGLIEDKTNLPEERLQQLAQMAESSKDTFELIKSVYNFLQEKTRYVSIQLGIGGFEPFPATKVDEVGYGDCKALTNYMRSMLQAVGIRSYYTLVRAGRTTRDIDPDFPAQEFNHVILTVPMARDTVFLECTNQFAPCGFLGDFTADRYALLVDKGRSHLVRTKSYGQHHNTWTLNANINIDGSGDAKIKESVVFKGLQYETVEEELRKTNEDQVKDEYKTNGIPGAKFNQIEYSAEPAVIPSVRRKRDIEVAKFAAKMGDRMFVPVNVLNQRTGVPKKVKERKFPFKVSMSYADSDSVVIILPEGYEIEYFPASVQVDSEFGQYVSALKQDGKQLVYTRIDKREGGTFPAEKYADYLSFVKQIVDADGQKIVIKKL